MTSLRGAPPRSATQLNAPPRDAPQRNATIFILSAPLCAAAHRSAPQRNATESEMIITRQMNDLRNICHSRARQAGWYSNPDGTDKERNVGEMLMLIVSEVSEAMEGHRKGLNDDHLPHRPMIEVELADAVIRIGDICGYLGLDLGGAIEEKIAYNLHRPDHKLENRVKQGGKSF